MTGVQTCALPIFPRSYNDAKAAIRKIGLGYVSIHACINNCVLFRNENANKHHCPKCNESRWKDAERHMIPRKVLRHFPLIPRLKRIFSNEKTSDEVKWHKLYRKHKVSGEMNHPADGGAWKHFDSLWTDFAEDARNIRLGLATDGFNPYNNASTNYNMWPVFVIPYNFAPWGCMEQSNFMMSLLIPGPESPGKDFDVFLQPLIEELQSLWKGVKTLDILSKEKDQSFTLKAAVLWCIHDFPALSTLSGRTTKGYAACTHCDKNPLSFPLKGKLGYFGHYRFLPKKHKLRINNLYWGIHGTHEKPGSYTQAEVKELVDKAVPLSPQEIEAAAIARKQQAAIRRKEHVTTRMKLKENRMAAKEAEITNKRMRSEPPPEP